MPDAAPDPAPDAGGPRLFRLTLEVGDLAQAASFYSELLGIEGRMQMGSRCYFTAGAVTLQVIADEIPHPAAKALYFAVADLDAVHARASALGCLSLDVVHGQLAGACVVRPWHERSFYCDDPWGNPLCFVADGTIYDG
jgi:predicted enzyme related to lactoylglutathione lyase